MSVTKISRDTFVARIRACLSDLSDDDPALLFVWLARLESLVTRPAAERDEAAKT